MKRLILPILLISMSVPSYADLKGLNMKADELELEQEVEDVERFGEDATAVETKRETERLMAETRALEKEIRRNKNRRERSEAKVKRLAGLYQQKSRLAARVGAQAKQAEAKKEKSEKSVAALRAKVDDKEQRAIRSIESRKDADKRLKQLISEKRQLDRRMRIAENTIKRNDRLRKSARAKSLNLSRKNSQLGRKVVRAESRAARL